MQEPPQTLEPELYTITAGGFSATADAFARDPESNGLWFVSMVGAQTALKAIWASMLKQPPDPAHIIRGADGMALSGGYQRCVIPNETIGTWTTKIARLPASGGWHALVYTKMAEFASGHDAFLLLAHEDGNVPALHHRFLDRRSPLPLHRSWAELAMAAGARDRGDSPAPVGRGSRHTAATPMASRCGTTSPARWQTAFSPCRTEPPSTQERSMHAMIEYRYDDGGRRRAAGYRGKTGDCVVRAIAICAGRDYRTVYLTMAEQMKRNGYTASGNAYATSERNRRQPRRRGQLGAKRVQDRVLELHGFGKVRLPAGAAPDVHGGP